MKEFIKRFSGLVKGTLGGFDRIVFKRFVVPYYPLVRKQILGVLSLIIAENGVPL